MSPIDLAHGIELRLRQQPALTAADWIAVMKAPVIRPRERSTFLSSTFDVIGGELRIQHRWVRRV